MRWDWNKWLYNEEITRQKVGYVAKIKHVYAKNIICVSPTKPKLVFCQQVCAYDWELDMISWMGCTIQRKCFFCFNPGCVVYGLSGFAVLTKDYGKLKQLFYGYVMRGHTRLNCMLLTKWCKFGIRDTLFSSTWIMVGLALATWCDRPCFFFVSAVHPTITNGTGDIWAIWMPFSSLSVVSHHWRELCLFVFLVFFCFL